mgnify:CR=1 FL=1
MDTLVVCREACRDTDRPSRVATREDVRALVLRDDAEALCTEYVQHHATLVVTPKGFRTALPKGGFWNRTLCHATEHDLRIVRAIVGARRQAAAREPLYNSIATNTLDT